MKYQNIVSNINKLMLFNHLTINDLSRLSGISLNGLKTMMDKGQFKIDNLGKIAETLHVPVYVLLALDIQIQRKPDRKLGHIIEVMCSMPDYEKVITDKTMNTKAKVIIKNSESEAYKDEANEAFNEMIKYQDINDEIKDHIRTLKNQVNDKKTIIDLIRDGKFLSYGRIMDALIENYQSPDGSISTDQLTAMSKSKVFDVKSIKSLYNSGVISEEDYHLFMSSIKKKP